MKYRWKLLLLLLAVTVPMAAFMPRYASRQMDRVSEEILSWARMGMERSIHEDLQDSVTGISTALSFAGDNLRIMLRYLSRRVLDDLQNPSPARQVFWVGDIVSGTAVPPGLGFDDQHWRLRSDGGRDRLRVSRQVPCFWAPLMDDAVRREAAQLADMGDDLAYAFDNSSISYLNITVVLESGLHMVYPAQGWNPSRYDARDTQWYQAARDASEVFWDGPVLDPSTGRTCSIGVAPLRDGQGRYQGAIAVYLPVGFYEHRLVDGLTLPEQTVFYLVALVGDGEAPGQLYIVQRSDGLPTPREGEHLVSADTETFAAMVSDMRASKSGVQRMEYRGKDCLWAYARGQNDVAVLFISSLESALEPVRQTQQRIAARFDQTVETLRLGWMACVLVAVLLAFIFSGKVTRPVVQLSSAMRKLGAGEFDVRVEVPCNDEFSQMARTFNAVAPQLQAHMRTMQSLDVARSIQQNLLPGTPPPVEGMELAGRCMYCDAVGGDYYDFVPMADGSVLAAIGDVSGHGIEAALLMTTARAVLRTRAAGFCSRSGFEDSCDGPGHGAECVEAGEIGEAGQVREVGDAGTVGEGREVGHAGEAGSVGEGGRVGEGGSVGLVVEAGESPQERGSGQAASFPSVSTPSVSSPSVPTPSVPSPSVIVAEVNDRLAQDVRQSGRFMTMFVCSVTSGGLRWVRAGHPPPLLLRRGADTPRALRRGGMSLGVVPGELYEERTLVMEPGDLLLAYSDGLVEACGEDGEQFGEERLRRTLSRCAGRSAQETVDCVVSELMDYLGDASLEDDVTLVAVRRSAP